MTATPQGGWLDDGTGAIDLGYHVFANPVEARNNVILAPPGEAADLLDSGGGLVDLAVMGQRVRDNLGDAERWIYETLSAVMSAAPASLGVENYMGSNAIWPGAVCLGGKGSVQAWTFAQIDYDFRASAAPSPPAWEDPPPTAEVYAGTMNAQDYAAGGVTLGTGVSLRFEAARSFPVRALPRARGARPVGPMSGGIMRLIVAGCVGAGTRFLPSVLAALARQIGPGPVTLTANGNAYADCVLEKITPQPTDWPVTNFEATFVQALASSVSSYPATTAGE